MVRQQSTSTRPVNKGTTDGQDGQRHLTPYTHTCDIRCLLEKHTVTDPYLYFCRVELRRSVNVRREKAVLDIKLERVRCRIDRHYFALGKARRVEIYRQSRLKGKCDVIMTDRVDL